MKRIVLDIEEIAQEAIEYANEELGGAFEQDGETLKVEVIDFVRENYTYNIIDMCIHQIFIESDIEY